MLRNAVLPFYEVEGEDEDKIGYTENQIAMGKEGVIVKCLSAPYISDLRSSRNHRAAMKN